VDLFIVCCVSNTNVAGLDNYVALKLDLRMVGVGGYISTRNRLITVCWLMQPPLFPILTVAYLSNCTVLVVTLSRQKYL